MSPIEQPIIVHPVAPAAAGLAGGMPQSSHRMRLSLSHRQRYSHDTLSLLRHYDVRDIRIGDLVDLLRVLAARGELMLTDMAAGASVTLERVHALSDVLDRYTSINALQSFRNRSLAASPDADAALLMRDAVARDQLQELADVHDAVRDDDSVPMADGEALSRAVFACRASPDESGHIDVVI